MRNVIYGRSAENGFIPVLVGNDGKVQTDASFGASSVIVQGETSGEVATTILTEADGTVNVTGSVSIDGTPSITGTVAVSGTTTVDGALTVAETSGAVATPILVDADGTVNVNTDKTLGNTIAAAAVTLSTSSTLVKASNADRVSITVRNVDASIVSYVGPSGSEVFQLNPGDAISLPVTAAIYAKSASGTPDVHYIEVYNV